MNIQSMVELFELVQDHYNSPYFPEDQVVSFLNYGQKKIFNDIVLSGDSQAEPNVIEGIRYTGKFELDLEKQNILADCIYLDQDVAAVGGVVLFDDIDTAVGKTTALVTRVADASNDKIEIVRQAEYDEFKNNYFTNAEYTLGRFGNNGIVIDGATTETFKVSVLAIPADMDLTEPIQPTLRTVHEAIVIEGLKLAGFAVDDELLRNLKR
jgi:hypothetical protein